MRLLFIPVCLLTTDDYLLSFVPLHQWGGVGNGFPFDQGSEIGLGGLSAMNSVFDHDGLVVPEVEAVFFQTILEPALVTTYTAVERMVGVRSFEPQRGRDDGFGFGIGIGMDEKA